MDKIALPETTRPLILAGHVLDVLRRLPSKSVQVAFTSPPYFGLRKYGTKPQIWGGGPLHTHEWSPTSPRRPRKASDATNALEQASLGGRNYDAQGGLYCACGAWEGELGAEPTPELYVQHLAADIGVELWRVLRDDGVFWLNLGDSHAGSGKAGNNPEYQARHTEFGKPSTEPSRFGRGGLVPPGLKPKDLIGIPWRVAFAFQEAGWYLRSDVIWSKPGVMPESVRDRPTRSHEYVFLFAKSGSPIYWTHRSGKGTRTQPDPDYIWKDRQTGKETGSPPADWETVEFIDPDGDERKRWTRVNLWSGHSYFYDNDAVRRPLSEASMKRLMQESFWEQEGGEKDYGQDGSGMNPNWSARKIVENMRIKTIDTPHAGGRRQAPEPGEEGWANLSGINLRTVWEIATQPFDGAHFAVFAEELARRCIALGSSAKGACSKCGAPYEKVHDGGNPSKWANSGEDLSGGAANTSNPQTSAGLHRDPGGVYPSKMIVGWSPTCECKDATIVPCLALDIFAGSGTMPAVAESLGLRSIGIELNEAYAEMARNRRLRGDGPRFEPLISEDEF